MTFHFIEKKLQIDPEVKSYAEKKIGKLDKFFKKPNDMHACIDSACALIERQIRKNKTRLEKKLRVGALEREIKPEFIPAEASDEGEEDFRIVRTKRFSLKPMTPEEAILQMNLLEHEFFVFLNMEDNDSFSVVYKRNEGGYGLISAADV